MRAKRKPKSKRSKFVRQRHDAALRPWHLDPREVGVFPLSDLQWRRIRSRTRRVEYSDVACRFLHRPTGIAVTAQVPGGWYTMEEFDKRVEEANTNAMADLERQVAGHLDIPGW